MKIGNFTVTSGKVIVSDPCYKDESDWATSISVPNGQWKASQTFGSDRVSSLVVEHASVKTKKAWELLTPNAGVDSGQMSIFDSKFYRDDSEAGDTALPDWMNAKRIKAEGKGEKFYGACCTLSNNQNSGGVLPHGVCTTSGYGDGVYPVFVKKFGGKVVAIKVKF